MSGIIKSLLRSLVVLTALLIVSIVALLAQPGSAATAYTAYNLNWELLGASLPHPNYGLGAAVGPSDLIYLVGGSDGGTNQRWTWRYNPTDNTFDTALAQMPTPRGDFVTAASGGHIYAIGGLNWPASGQFLQTNEMYDPSLNKWTTMTPMPTGRYEIAGATMPDGSIYVLGGDNCFGCFLKTVEAYDPEHNTWSTKAPLPAPTASFTATVAGGRLYAIGGRDQQNLPLKTVYSYDPATDTWTRVADMNVPRAWADSVTGSNGRIYVMSGADTLTPAWLASVEEYNPAANKWCPVGDMPTGAADAGAVALGDSIYVFGGVGSSNPNDSSPHPSVQKAGVVQVDATNVAPTVAFGSNLQVQGLGFSVSGSFVDPDCDAWIGTVDYGDGAGPQPLALGSDKTFQLNHTYSQPGTYAVVVTVADDQGGTGSGTLNVTVAATGHNLEWQLLDTSLPQPNKGLGAAVGPDGFVYLVGGSDGVTNQNWTWRFNPADNTFHTNVAQMPTARSDIVVAASGGRIYAIGGYNGQFLQTNEMYDPASNTWTSADPMPTGRYEIAGATMPDGTIYVLGGRSCLEGPQCWLKTVEAYNPADKSWTTKAALPAYRSSFTATVAGGKLYSIGGLDELYHSQASVYVYDPSQNAWSRVADLRAPRAWADSATGSNGHIYVMSGTDTDLGDSVQARLQSVEEYNPTADRWCPAGDLPKVAADAGTVALGDLIYLFGGVYGLSPNNPSPEPYVQRATIVPYQAVNIPPAVTFGSNLQVQGLSFSVSGSFVDPDCDAWTGTVDYGDGTGAQPLALGSDKTFQLSHTYSQTGNHSVVVTVSDDQGGSASATLSCMTACTLSGRLLDRNGKGLPNQNIFGVSTDATGRYSIQLPAGNYGMQIVGGNGGDRSLAVPASYLINTKSRQTVLSVTQDAVLDLTVPSQEVVVHVQDSAGNRVQNATVSAVPPSNGIVCGGGLSLSVDPAVSGLWGRDTTDSAITDASGIASLWLLPTCDTGYDITATPPAGSPLSASTIHGLAVTSDLTQTIVLQAVAVTIGSDLQVNGLSFSVSGSFVGPEGGIWTGTVDYGDGAGAQPLALGSDKTFHLSHTYGQCVTYSVVVTVSDDQGGSASATLSVTATCTLSGRLLDRNGKGLPSQSVAFGVRRGGVYSATTDATGYYSVQLPAGSYGVDVAGGNGGDVSLAVPASYHVFNKLWGAVLTVTQDMSGLDLTVPSQEVVVHVQDSAGNRVQNATVSAVPPSNGIVCGGGLSLSVDPAVSGLRGDGTTESAITDASGIASLWLLPTCDTGYDITATPPAGSPLSASTIHGLAVTSDLTQTIVLHALPRTTATVVPPADSQGNHTGAVTVTLTATAAPGFSVAQTYFTLDGGAQQVYSAPFAVSGVGDHTLTYWSVDDAAVSEAPSTLPIRIVPGNPVPSLASISPTSATAGSGDLHITVDGTGFIATSVVRWHDAVAGALDLTTTYVSPTQLSAMVPAARIATPRTGEITVVNPAPGGGTSSLLTLFVTETGTSVASSNSGTSSDPGGTAAASAGGSGPATPGSLSASAPGAGTVTVATYASDPGGAPSFASAGTYFDVHVSSSSSFASVSIVNCNLNGGTEAYWWNGTGWVLASEQSYDSAKGCITVTVTGSTTPNVTDLQGAAFGIGRPDVTRPTTSIASVPPTPDGSNGWYKSNVHLTVAAVDDAGGSGVAETRCVLDPAIAPAAFGDMPTGCAYSGAGADVPSDGQHTLYAASKDNAGNVEALKTLTVRIDKAPPTATCGAADGAWHAGDLSIHCAVTDTVSGLANSGDASFSLTTSVPAGTETADAVTNSRSICDVAGNCATAGPVGGNKVDRKPPTTTATANPGPNAQGWNNTGVTVALAATDNGSGVAGTSYKLDSANWATYTVPLTLTTQGVYNLVYHSLDKAGNQEAERTLTVKIDKTAPEAWLQFDPASKDVVVIGKDAQSGVPSGPISPATTTVTTWAQADDDAVTGTGGLAQYQALLKLLVGKLTGTARAELRTYNVTDVAGNTAQIVVKVRKLGTSVVARIVSLRYQGGQALTPARNGLAFAWLANADGSLKALVQGVGVGQGKDTHIAVASYTKTSNQSTIVTLDGVLPQLKINTIQRAGIMVLLHVATGNGQLAIGF